MSAPHAEGGSPTTGRRLLLTVIAVALTVAVSALGAFGAFSATTSNGGNQIAVGTVAISDNDAGQALYSVANAKPGDTVTRCIRVVYTGTLDADVRLYTSSVIGPLGPYVDLEVTPGTQATPSFPGCSGFTASGAAIFTGTLSAFATAHSGWANGLPTVPAAATRWTADDAVVYRITATVRDDQNAHGLSTDPHAFVWEARNQ